MLVITTLLTHLKLLNFCTNIENSIEQVLFSGRDVKKKLPQTVTVTTCR